MDRDTALRLLQERLPGRDLYRSALEFGVTVEKNGKINKGWVGQTVERLADLSLSNRAHRDGSDFELKTTRLIPMEGRWVPKETIKVTNLNPEVILEEEFETSIFWNKLQRLIVVGCFYDSPVSCQAVKINAVDVEALPIKAAIKAFWEDVRHTVSEGEIGNYNNLGNSEDLIQLRPTGNGKLWSVCPITQERYPARAFYATKRFLNTVLSDPK